MPQKLESMEVGVMGRQINTSYIKYYYQSKAGISSIFNLQTAPHT